MFRMDNTEGFTEAELDWMNADLSRRLESDEFQGLEKPEREKYISEDILGRF